MLRTDLRSFLTEDIRTGDSWSGNTSGSTNGQSDTTLGEGLLEVRAPCHDSALAIGDFDDASYILLKVD